MDTAITYPYWTGDAQSPFDQIRHTRPDGSEYWSARELMIAVAYDKWERFAGALDRAMTSCTAQGADVNQAFSRLREEGTGGRPREDYALSRFGAYLTVMNGDPRKPEIAAAQAYFAVKTRQAETRPAVPALSGPELMAAALIEAQHTLQQAQTRALTAETTMRTLEPRANAWDAFLASTGDYSVNEAAKILARDKAIHTGEKRLRALLEEWHWIYRHSGIPRAMQAQVDNGRLTERARYHYHPVTGQQVADPPQVRITPKGIDAAWHRLTGPQAATLFEDGDDQ